MSLGPVLLGSEQLSTRRRLVFLLCGIRYDVIKYPANTICLYEFILLNNLVHTMLCKKLKIHL